MGNTSMGTWIGRSSESVKHMMRELGLKRSEMELRKIVAYGASRTYFSHGRLPKNTRKDGDISIRVESSGIGYKHIRIAVGKWALLHRINYEKKHGPLPEGIILRCKSSDSLNCDPDNWEPINRNEHLNMNTGRKNFDDKWVAWTIIRDPEARKFIPQEIIELKKAQLQLKRKIKEYEKV
jgi:hypothetical protein